MALYYMRSLRPFRGNDVPANFRDLLNSGGVQAFAHRGANNAIIPENTLAAFAEAVALGYRLLETDIHASSDGVPFVFHDADLLRLTGDPRRLEDLRAADIASLTIHGHHAIPKLADLLEEFPDTCLNLDAKSEAATAPMGQMIRATNAQDRVCIGSFSDRRIRMVMDAAGQALCHSLGTAHAVQFYASARLHLPQRFSACCVQFPVAHRGVRLITKRTLAHARRIGLKVHVWTINDAPEMHRLLDLGVDGLMADDCALLKSVLTERALWQG